MADFSPLLGVAGDWAGAHDALDAYTAKAGGPPVRIAAASCECSLLRGESCDREAACATQAAAQGLTRHACCAARAQAWPEGAQPPPPERLLCGRCGGATSLVMQARALRLRARVARMCRLSSASDAPAPQLYAPLDAASVGTDVHERFLYIFACLAPGCRNEAAGWSALRAQRPAPPPPALPQPAAASAPAAPPQPADDWGVAGADDWGGGDAAAGNAASTAGEGAPALDGLAEALQAAQLQGAAADAAAAKLRAGRGDAAAAQRPARPPPSAATLPEFYVAAVAEPEADGSAAAGPRDAAAARAAQLAAEYAARRGGTSTAESAAAAGEPGGGDDGGEGESWAGEQYERASVRGVDRAYLKFQKRLRRCPDQCLRCALFHASHWF